VLAQEIVDNLETALDQLSAVVEGVKGQRGKTESHYPLTEEAAGRRS